MISVTNVVENVFCPKFTYYGLVMGLAQYEEKRGAVISGKKHHAVAEKTNKSVIPKDLVGRKISSQKFYSKKHGYVGIIDHCIITDDEVVLIERKYSDRAHVQNTIKVQLGLLAILIEENLHRPVRVAYVIFTKDGSRTEIKVEIDKDIRRYALDMLEETRGIINTALMPKSHYDKRCVNCCYSKICDVGSLNRD